MLLLNYIIYLFLYSVLLQIYFILENIKLLINTQLVIALHFSVYSQKHFYFP